MKYFYLTPDKQTRGPYSAADLRALHAAGAIQDDTYTAAAGDATWRPYSEQTLTDDGTPAAALPVPELSTPGACPFCGKEMEGVSCPAVCPHCGKTLHPGNNSNLWVNFVSCMRRYVCFRGRATRTEFWSFYLFSFLFNFAVSTIWDVAAALCMGGGINWIARLNIEDISFSDANIAGLIIGAVLCKYIFPLVFLLPTWGVLARRLHDIGHNMTGLIFNICGSALSLISLFAIIALAVPPLLNMSSMSEEAIIEYFTETHISALLLFLSMFVIGSLIALGAGIYLFIACLLPGTRGANMYGPSAI